MIDTWICCVVVLNDREKQGSNKIFWWAYLKCELLVFTLIINYCVRPLIYIFHYIIDNNSNQASYDHHSYEHNLSNCLQKPKKVRTSKGFEPMTSQYRCDALTNWAMEPRERVYWPFVESNVPMKKSCIWNHIQPSTQAPLTSVANQDGGIFTYRTLTSHRKLNCLWSNKCFWSLLCRDCEMRKANRKKSTEVFKTVKIHKCVSRTGNEFLLGRTLVA